MRRLLLLAVVLLSLPAGLDAQSRHYLKVGGNVSRFRTEQVTHRLGLSLGAGYSFAPLKSENIYLALELLYCSKRMKLGERTWPTNSWDRDVVVGDINVSLSYVEIHAEPGYSVPVRTNMRIRVQAGPSLSIPVANRTRAVHQRITFLTDQQKAEFKFDYKRYDVDPGGIGLLSWTRGVNPTLSVNIGATINYASYIFAFRYSRALMETKDFIGLTLHDKVDSFYLLFGIQF